MNVELFLESIFPMIVAGTYFILVKRRHYSKREINNVPMRHFLVALIVFVTLDFVGNYLYAVRHPVYIHQATINDGTGRGP